jgi:hypothetical protein
MAAPAPRFEVAVRSRALGPVGFHVVELGPKAVAAVDADHPVERRWRPQLQGDGHLDRDVSGPAGEVTQVDPVVEHPVEKGILGDLLGDLRRHRPDPQRGSCRALRPPT